MAVAIFAVLSTSFIGAVVYSRVGAANVGERARANLLAEEGLEAVRTIRDNSFASLANGTYGLAQSGSPATWAFSGSSDTTGIFTRQITIASGSNSNRKVVTAAVSWNQNGTSVSTSATTELSNWVVAMGAKTWANPILASSLDVGNSISGYKIATSGNYSYVVRNTSAATNFFVINHANLAAPTIVASLTLPGKPTNVAVSGNYVYVTNTLDTAELQIVSVATPASPSVAASYDAAGNADGMGVYISGTTAYLVRVANGGSDEFVMLNVSSPASPTRIGSYSLNVTMYEVYVSGTVAYVATGSDTQEVLVLNVATPSLITLGTSVNLSGTIDATTISGVGNTIFVGQGTSLSSLSATTPLVPVVKNSITLPGIINDVSYDSTHTYVFAATSYTTAALQIVNATNLASLSILSSVASGSNALTGIDYNSGLDRLMAVSTSTTNSYQIFAPN